MDLRCLQRRLPVVFLGPTRSFDGHEEIIGGLFEGMERQGEFIERSGLSLPWIGMWFLAQQ